MEYLNFVVEVVRTGKKLTKDQMKFAYLMFHKTFGETPEQSANSVLQLDQL